MILASGSTIRAQLLRRIGVSFDVEKPLIDESVLKKEKLAAKTPAAELAHFLALAKAESVEGKFPKSLVLGCDQILICDGTFFSKPRDQDEGLAQLRMLRGRKHQLITSAVAVQNASAVWHHTGTVDLHMRDVSDIYLEDYIARNWKSVRHAVGSYKLEEEGGRLFHRIEGDYFHVLGLPLLEITTFLIARGELAI
ncbi:MAG: nucleoside triphosphate pyrophosphatase [Pseudomonadota bacterium]